MIEMFANLDVNNLEAGIDFYHRAFGLKLGRRFGNQGAEMLGASSRLYLLLKPSGTPPSPGFSSLRTYARHWTPVHLDFVVDALDPAVERAQLAGAKLEGEIQDREWGRMANMADPFGHGFCLLEMKGRGYDEIA